MEGGERRQRGKRWTQGARHGGRREEAAGKPLDAWGARHGGRKAGSGETAGSCGGERRAGAVSQSWGWTATWLSMNK